MDAPLLDSVRWFPDASPLSDVWEACQPNVARAERAYRDAVRALRRERDALAQAPAAVPLRADQARQRAARAPQLRAQLAHELLALQKTRDQAIEAALAPAHDAALGLGVRRINQTLHRLALQGQDRCVVRCALGPNGATIVGACDLLLPLPFLYMLVTPDGRPGVVTQQLRQVFAQRGFQVTFLAQRRYIGAHTRPNEPCCEPPGLLLTW